jgi:hypothetical protein
VVHLLAPDAGEDMVPPEQLMIPKTAKRFQKLYFRLHDTGKVETKRLMVSQILTTETMVINS